ncbi:hypothetical protein ABZ470_31870 [Streptosporangium sp. NPDC020072]|uniref:hypothetical protein n=1 Tax=Streptosporangium sp. NPDC020072 TaxID=3154788 RepID=UPI00341A4A9A
MSTFEFEMGNVESFKTEGGRLIVTLRDAGFRNGWMNRAALVEDLKKRAASYEEKARAQAESGYYSSAMSLGHYAAECLDISTDISTGRDVAVAY